MPKNKELKKQEAEKRQQNRDKRSPQDQVAVLDSKFGKDLGAKKERAKLISLLNKKEEKQQEKKEKKKTKKVKENE